MHLDAMSNEPATFSPYLEHVAMFQGINLITGTVPIETNNPGFFVDVQLE